MARSKATQRGRTDTEQGCVTAPSAPSARSTRTRRRRWRTSLVIAGLLLGGVGVQVVVSAPVSSAAAQEAGLVADGGDLYFQSCAGCHGQRGEGSQRGPALAGVGEASVHFQLSTGRMPMDAEQRQPERGPVAFNAEEIDALVAYVASLGEGGLPIPDVDLAGADVAEGQRLYQLNCAACHSSTGAGGALTGGATAPNLGAATPVQVAEATRLGPGPMPRFGHDALDDAQVDDIASYVKFLQESENANAGGWGLGRLGPVMEGLVAMAIGLGVLIILIRMIGERAPRPRPQDTAGGDSSSNGTSADSTSADEGGR